MTAKPTFLVSVLVLLAGCSSSPPGNGGNNGNPDAGGSGGTGVVTGVVSDIGTGVRIAGATVSGGGKNATTDAQGGFSLTGLASGAVELSIAKSGYAPGYANATSGNSSDSVYVRLKAEGTPQSYTTGNATTLTQSTANGPYAVILQPNSVDTSDSNITVSITPLDPTTEAAALPGSLVAGGASNSLLLPVTFAEFTLRDSTGQRLNLKSSASAQVELPIPAPLRDAYPLNSKIHCYAYNSTTGKWDDFVDGTVQTSSVDGTTPVLAASIRHFSWYGGAPEGNDCVDLYVKVTSAVDGRPLGNARVEATPGTVAYTDADGNAVLRSTVGGTGSKFTAYQTGIDVDGSLTGMAGAKYIEFGEVTEELTGLVTKPCSSAISGPSSGPGSAGQPVPIKIGVVKNFLYNALAILSAFGGAGSVAVILESGVPDETGQLQNPLPASGAKITLVESGGGTPVLLPEISAGSGYYSTPGTFPITPGKTYVIAIDADGDGSVDGSGSASAVGDLAFTNPTEGATVAGNGLIASWTDSGAGNSGYSIIYFLFISGENGGFYYVGADRQATVTNLLTGGGAPLPAGVYAAEVTGWSGGLSLLGGTGGLTFGNNITGAGVSGTFYSSGQSTTINFTAQ
jgi:hypothetical protein